MGNIVEYNAEESATHDIRDINPVAPCLICFIMDTCSGSEIVVKICFNLFKLSP